MKVRIGNDIKINLTIHGPHDYTFTNVKQIKCLLINECMTCCDCCGCSGKRCPIERRFPMEPFPQYYTPTPYTLNTCGKARYHTDPWNCKACYSDFGGWFNDYHWWPGYRGFGLHPRKFIGDCCRYHMNHAMDIFYCDPKPGCPNHGCHKNCCDCMGPDTDFIYNAKATLLSGENKVSCIFPAYDLIMCGSYKLVLVITTYEQGWGCRNLHTETIDYGTLFELVTTEDGQLGNITIDADNLILDDSTLSSIRVSSESESPQYTFISGTTAKIGTSDIHGNIYLIIATTKDGRLVPYAEDWDFDELLFTSSNPDVILIDKDGTMHIGTVDEDTTVTISIIDTANQSISLLFDILVRTTVVRNPFVDATSLAVEPMFGINTNGRIYNPTVKPIRVPFEVQGEDLSKSIQNGFTLYEVDSMPTGGDDYESHVVRTVPFLIISTEEDSNTLKKGMISFAFDQNPGNHYYLYLYDDAEYGSGKWDSEPCIYYKTLSQLEIAQTVAGFMFTGMKINSYMVRRSKVISKPYSTGDIYYYGCEFSGNSGEETSYVEVVLHKILGDVKLLSGRSGELEIMPDSPIRIVLNSNIDAYTHHISITTWEGYNQFNDDIEPLGESGTIIFNRNMGDWFSYNDPNFGEYIDGVSSTTGTVVIKDCSDLNKQLITHGAIRTCLMYADGEAQGEFLFDYDHVEGGQMYTIEGDAATYEEQMSTVSLNYITIDGVDIYPILGIDANSGYTIHHIGFDVRNWDERTTDEYGSIIDFVKGHNINVSFNDLHL